MAVKHLSDSDFQEFIADGIAVVDFWATWCGPCRTFGPVFEAVSENHPGVKFGKFEITDQNKEIPVRYGIRSIPATIAFKNGAPVDTKIGLMDGGMLGDWIKALS